MKFPSWILLIALFGFSNCIPQRISQLPQEEWVYPERIPEEPIMWRKRPVLAILIETPTDFSGVSSNRGGNFIRRRNNCNLNLMRDWRIPVERLLTSNNPMEEINPIDEFNLRLQEPTPNKFLTSATRKYHTTYPYLQRFNYRRNQFNSHQNRPLFNRLPYPRRRIPSKYRPYLPPNVSQLKLNFNHENENIFQTTNNDPVVDAVTIPTTFYNKLSVQRTSTPFSEMGATDLLHNTQKESLSNQREANVNHPQTFWNSGDQRSKTGSFFNYDTPIEQTPEWRQEKVTNDPSSYITIFHRNNRETVKENPKIIENEKKLFYSQLEKQITTKSPDVNTASTTIYDEEKSKFLPSRNIHYLNDFLNTSEETSKTTTSNLVTLQSSQDYLETSTPSLSSGNNSPMILNQGNKINSMQMESYDLNEHYETLNNNNDASTSRQNYLEIEHLYTDLNKNISARGISGKNFSEKVITTSVNNKQKQNNPSEYIYTTPRYYNHLSFTTMSTNDGIETNQNENLEFVQGHFVKNGNVAEVSTNGYEGKGKQLTYNKDSTFLNKFKFVDGQYVAENEMSQHNSEKDIVFKIPQETHPNKLSDSLKSDKLGKGSISAINFNEGYVPSTVMYNMKNVQYPLNTESQIKPKSILWGEEGHEEIQSIIKETDTKGNILKNKDDTIAVSDRKTDMSGTVHPGGLIGQTNYETFPNEYQKDSQNIISKLGAEKEINKTQSDYLQNKLLVNKKTSTMAPLIDNEEKMFKNIKNISSDEIETINNQTIKSNIPQNNSEEAKFDQKTQFKENLDLKHEVKDIDSRIIDTKLNDNQLFSDNVTKEEKNESHIMILGGKKQYSLPVVEEQKKGLNNTSDGTSEFLNDSKLANFTDNIVLEGKFTSNQRNDVRITTESHIMLIQENSDTKKNSINKSLDIIPHLPTEGQESIRSENNQTNFNTENTEGDKEVAHQKMESSSQDLKKRKFPFNQETQINGPDQLKIYEHGVHDPETVFYHPKEENVFSKPSGAILNNIHQDRILDEDLTSGKSRQTDSQRSDLRNPLINSVLGPIKDKIPSDPDQRSVRIEGVWNPREPSCSNCGNGEGRLCLAPTGVRLTPEELNQAEFYMVLNDKRIPLVVNGGEPGRPSPEVPSHRHHDNDLNFIRREGLSKRSRSPEERSAAKMCGKFKCNDFPKRRTKLVQDVLRLFKDLSNDYQISNGTLFNLKLK